MQLKSFNFTKRYILALSIIALLSAFAYFNLQHLISSQYINGNLINISGKQRMLSQQISLNSIYYKIGSLKDRIDEMEKNHKQLLSYPLSSELKKIYFNNPTKLDYEVKIYLKHAKIFLKSRSGKSLTYLLNNSKILLKDLDKATTIYVKEAKDSTKLLKTVELFIFLTTLLTLFFEAIFIFRPANKQIAEDKKLIINEKDYSNIVIESSTNAIITLDSQLNIKRYNKMAEKVFGYKREDMLNRKSFSKIIPLFREQNIDTFLDTLKLLSIKDVQELEGLDKSGNRFPIRISFGLNRSENNLLIVANIQNISKEKLKDKLLEQQSKFAALGEMIAIIAHQWRQPLAQLNFNNIYLKRKINDKELKSELEDNENIIQFMSDTITNFQNFYKKDDTNREFYISNSIEQVLKILDSILKLKEIKIDKNLDPTIKTYGNSNSFSQVILSIIQNAIDVIVSRGIENPNISISVKKEKKIITIEIEDNAKGIDVHPISNIFKPFTSKKLKPSTGVGLYMCKMIIEDKFKGKIEAENRENGAIFKLILSNI